MRETPWLWAVPLFIALFFPRVTQGDTIYTSFGPGQSFDYSEGLSICGSADGVCTQSIAAPFTPGGNFLLSQIDVAAEYGYTTQPIEVALAADLTGKPGTVIESWILSNVPEASIGWSPESVVPISPVTLESGMQYWVELLPAVPATDASWNFYNYGVKGTVSLMGSAVGPTWTNETNGIPAFDVLGQPVPTPEPDSLGILASALVGIILWRRTRS